MPTITVVCGGPSAEVEVSRVSGRCVADALRATYPDTSVLELDQHVASALLESRPDLVFPVLHGPPGEDGSFQGLLEILRLPYVGSGVLASALAMDKSAAKQMFRMAGLPVARDLVVSRSEDPRRAASRIVEALGARVVVKPSSQGSALGVLFPTGEEAIASALEKAWSYDDHALVEERIEGKEITVAVLDEGQPIALPVIEVRTPEGTWYDYEHRYTVGLSEHIVPAPLPEEQYRRTQEVAVEAFRALGCRDLGRVDFVVPETGEPVVLEINTLPGMTPTSLYPDAARAVGIGFEELVARLAARALERG